MIKRYDVSFLAGLSGPECVILIVDFGAACLFLVDLSFEFVNYAQ